MTMIFILAVLLLGISYAFWRLGKARITTLTIQASAAPENLFLQTSINWRQQAKQLQKRLEKEAAQLEELLRRELIPTCVLRDTSKVRKVGHGT